LGRGLWALSSARFDADQRRYNYLHHMVERKKVEVEDLLRRHTDADDPLLMRMSYMASRGNYNLTQSIKREYFGKEELIQMSVMIDVKRRSPTIPNRREIVDYGKADEFVRLLAAIHVDAFLINTDAIEYGGSQDDLKLASKAMKKFRPEKPPPCVQKDLIIHPIQVGTH
jgi:indole-3-glycerol phosphate synthase